MTDFVYLMVNGEEWEDMIILLTDFEAIEASIAHPDIRIEVFSKNDSSGYSPTYNYYKNGKLTLKNHISKDDCMKHGCTVVCYNARGGGRTN